VKKFIATIAYVLVVVGSITNAYFMLTNLQPDKL